MMKNIDVLNGKIEEVRNGNNPCSDAKFEKSIKIVGADTPSNGYQAEFDSVSTTMSVPPNGTEISKDETAAADKNKDGCQDTNNSAELTATAFASPVNKADDSSAACSNNIVQSGLEASGLSTSNKRETSDNCVNSIDSTEDGKTPMRSKLSTKSESSESEEKKKLICKMSSSLEVEGFSSNVEGSIIISSKVQVDSSIVDNTSRDVVKLNDILDSKNVSKNVEEGAEKSETLESLLSDMINIIEESSTVKTNTNGPVNVEGNTASEKDFKSKEIYKTEESSVVKEVTNGADNVARDAASEKDASSKEISETEESSLVEEVSNGAGEVGKDAAGEKNDTSKEISKTEESFLVKEVTNGAGEVGKVTAGEKDDTSKEISKTEKSSLVKEVTNGAGEVGKVTAGEKDDTSKEISKTEESSLLKEVTNGTGNVGKDAASEKDATSKEISKTEESLQKISNDESENTQETSPKLDGLIAADSERKRPIKEEEKGISENSSSSIGDLEKGEKTILKPVEEIPESKIKQDESKREDIAATKDKNYSTNAVSEPIDKSSLKPDLKVTLPDACKDNKTKQKLEEFVEDISVSDKSMETEDVLTSTSNVKEAKSDMDFISIDDDLKEQGKQTVVVEDGDNKLKDVGGEKLEGDEEKILNIDEDKKLGDEKKKGEEKEKNLLLEGDEKAVVESNMKTDESVDADVDKNQSSNVDEKKQETDNKTNDKACDEKSLKGTVIENEELMEVNDSEMDGKLPAENYEQVKVSDLVEVEELVEKASESKLQDAELSKTSDATEEKTTEAIEAEIAKSKETAKSSDRSTVLAESTSAEDPQLPLKRPAEVQLDNSKKMKTDDSSTTDKDCLKKRSPSPITDGIAEPKRKRTLSAASVEHNSKSSVKTSEPEKSTIVDHVSSNEKESVKIDLDNYESDVSLDLELKSDSSEGVTRASSVSDVEVKCVCKCTCGYSLNKDELLRNILGCDKEDSENKSRRRDKSKKMESSGAASLLKENIDGKSDALLKETFRRMKKSDLEDLMTIKMTEILAYKNELGELRANYQAAQESIERWIRRCNYFEKIDSEFTVKLKKYTRDLELLRAEKGPLSLPSRFSRSVGLQVIQPTNPRKQQVKSRQQLQHEERMQLQYKEQQELHQLQQHNQQKMHAQQLKEQQLREKRQKEEELKEKEENEKKRKETQQRIKEDQERIEKRLLKTQERFQTSLKPAATTNVRSSTPRRIVSSKPAQPATNIQSPPCSSAASSPSTTASASAGTSTSAPIPVAITASKMARQSPAKSHEVIDLIDLTDKEEKGAAANQDSKTPTSYTVVRQMPPANNGNGQRTYLVPSSAVSTNTGQLLLATTAGLTKLPIGTLAANGTMIVKNGAMSNVLKPVHTVRVTSATHPAPLPPCPPAIHQEGWRLAPPRPQLVVRKTPNGAGIMLSWTLALGKGYEEIASYQLYAYQEGSAPPTSTLWKKVGDVKALPLPMACTLTQFVEGHKYHFAVRAVDIHARVGHFSGPSTITLN
ncbi:calponin homology domain-containing protein DDB_G0272472 isoform X4 [Nilaparvata lugens]|nr:calponin homology domain-containing protein DDB_G0272472 isoform X4 [Nilaparvata lugens]XP_039284389.1 calponin homology domain-containing protein DDB_G0272472 isoform X4 [Nilaparvata lugens]